MFSQASIAVERQANELYGFIATLRTQLQCWPILTVPNLEALPDNARNAKAYYTLGRAKFECTAELHCTRPGTEVVLILSWHNGELAAEWRIIDEGRRTRLELSIEGQGGGLANSVRLRPLAKEVLSRLKQSFFKS